MQENHINDFFSGFAKIVFIIPLVILALGLYIRYGQTLNSTEFKPDISPLPSSTPQNTYPTPKSTFTPLKPFICTVNEKTASMSAYRNGNDIRFQLENNTEKTVYLVHNDCLYIWKSGPSKGKKQCGVTQQIRMVDMLLSSGFIELNSVLDMVPKNILPTDITKLIRTCKNTPPKDPLLFTLPKGVAFEEVKE